MVERNTNKNIIKRKVSDFHINPVTIEISDTIRKYE